MATPTTVAQRTPIVPPSPPSTPRLVLVPVLGGEAVLDGGWWPRSSDPVAELPGLVLALTDHVGPIRHLLLNADAWDRQFGRLTVGTQVVRLGWSVGHPALAIAITEGGDQMDLLVVPPRTAEPAAWSALEAASDPANRLRAPDILATVARVPLPASGDESDRASVWENEGGHLGGGRGFQLVTDAPVALRG